MKVIRDASGGPVATVSCGSNPHRYSCGGCATVKAVRLRMLPAMGIRLDRDGAAARIWRGLRSYGYEHAYALTPCPQGHRREVVMWLTDEPVMTEEPEPGSPRQEMEMEKRITVWPDDTMPGDAFEGPAWIVSRDDESSDTIAIFRHQKDAEASGRKLAKLEGLPLYYQDERGVPTKIL